MENQSKISPNDLICKALSLGVYFDLILPATLYPTPSGNPVDPDGHPSIFDGFSMACSMSIKPVARGALAVCPMSHPQLSWPLVQLRHRAGNILKDQGYWESIRASPRNPMECGLITGYEHDAVNHTKKEYARGDVHENRAECLFALLEPYLRVFRGISKTNLPG